MDKQSTTFSYCLNKYHLKYGGVLRLLWEKTKVWSDSQTYIQRIANFYLIVANNMLIIDALGSSTLIHLKMARECLLQYINLFVNKSVPSSKSIYFSYTYMCICMHVYCNQDKTLIKIKMSYLYVGACMCSYVGWREGLMLPMFSF